MDEIIEKDLVDGEKGIYLMNIIFDYFWLDFFSFYFNIWLELL